MACSDPTSCRCSNDVRANVDGVYRIREEVTDEDCGLNNSWSIVGSSLHLDFILFSVFLLFKAIEIYPPDLKSLPLFYVRLLVC